MGRGPQMIAPYQAFPIQIQTLLAGLLRCLDRYSH